MSLRAFPTDSLVGRRENDQRCLKPQCWVNLSDHLDCGFQNHLNKRSSDGDNDGDDDDAYDGEGGEGKGRKGEVRGRRKE